MTHAIARRPVAQRLREWLIARCLAPINLDRSQVSDVTIDGQSVSAVTMDGDQVFGGAIPDSVEYQVRVEEFADPWPFNIGSIDMSINGLSASTFSNGEDSVSGDGTDDHGTADGPQTLPSNETFGLAMTVQYQNATDATYFIGSRDGNSDFFVRTGNRGTAGDIEILTIDGNSNRLEVYTDNIYDDGTPRTVVINKNGNSAADFSIYVDDMTTPVSLSTFADEAFDHTAYSNSQLMGFWDVFTDGSFDDRNMAFDMGIFEFNTAPYSESERNDFVNRRPEV